MRSYSEESAQGGLPSQLGLMFAFVLVVLHFCLSLWYASETPYRQAGVILSSRHQPVPDIGAPDERQHVNYVAHLLNGDGFPILKVGDPNLSEDYQSHQPPTFYVLEAAWSKLMGVADVTGQDAGLRLRTLDCLLGSLTILGVYFLAAWGFRNPGIGICAAAVAALLPMNIALSGAVSNDPLLFCLCTWALALCARAIQHGWSVKSGLAVGVLVGLALLTKTTALALLPAILVAVVFSPVRPSLKVWIAAMVPMLMLPLGWWIRNQHLYGDPFAIRAFNDAFVGSPQAKTFIDAVGLPTYLLSWVGWWTIRSFYGAFGYMDIWLNEASRPIDNSPNLLYRLLMIVSLVFLVGWIMAWKNLRAKAMVSVQAMNLTFAVVVALLFLSFNLHYFQAQARYLYPAIGPISCAFGIGAWKVVKERWTVALVLIVLVFGGTAIYAGMQLPAEFQKRITG